YDAFSTAPFAVSSGTHNITFAGLNPNGGDNTALIDNVRIDASATPGLVAQVGPVATPRSTPVDSVTISFNRAVSGFDLSDLALTRDAVAVPLDGTTLSSIDGQTYTLDGLSAATAS